MHDEAFAAVLDMAMKHELYDIEIDALDLGGQYVNGSCRDIFSEARWTGLDLVDGPGIDIVADATTWVPDKEYDLVLCTEVLEHVSAWPLILKTAYNALKPGGVLLLTCASTDRPPHSAHGLESLPWDEYYGNIDPTLLREFALNLFSVVDVKYNYPPGDAYLYAVK